MMLLDIAQSAKGGMRGAGVITNRNSRRRGQGSRNYDKDWGHQGRKETRNYTQHRCYNLWQLEFQTFVQLII